MTYAVPICEARYISFVLVHNPNDMYSKTKGSILQYFRPSVSYQLPLRPLFCLFFEWPLYTGFTVHVYSIPLYFKLISIKSSENIFCNDVYRESYISVYVLTFIEFIK